MADTSLSPTSLRLQQLYEEKALAESLSQPPPPSALSKILGDEPGSHFLKGVQRGLTLGYTGQDPDPGLPGYAGEFVGSTVPFLGALKAGSMALRGVQGMPALAKALTAQGFGGALYGGLESPDPEEVAQMGEVEARAKRATTTGLLVPAIGATFAGASRGISKLLGKGKAAPPPEVSPEAQSVTMADILEKGPTQAERDVTMAEVLRGPEAKMRDAQAMMEKLDKQLSNPLLKDKAKRASLESQRGEMQRLFANADEMLRAEESRGVPSIQPVSGQLPVPIRPGQLPATMPGGQPPIEVLPKGNIDRASKVADKNLESILAEQSIDLYPQPDGSFKAIGPGPKVTMLADRNELQGFAVTAKGTPPQPVEMKTPLEDVPRGTPMASASTFEKVVSGKKLTKVDKANLALQKAEVERLSRLEEGIDPNVKPGTMRSMLPPDTPPIAGGGGRRGEALGPEPNMINPAAQPALTGSPTIRNMSADVTEAEMATKDEIQKWATFKQERILANVGDDKHLREMVGRYIEGDLDASQVPMKVKAAGDAMREMYADIAERLNLPQNDYYLTHKTNFNTLYQSLRERFMQMGSVRDFATDEQAMALGLKEKDFQRLKSAMESAGDWNSLSRSVKDELKGLWNFDNRVKKWEELPRFIREKLPKEVFSPYLLPRNGGVPYTRDVSEIFDSYVPIMVKKIRYDPLMDKWDPIIKNLPGTDSVFTPKGYANAYLQKEVFNRPSWDERHIASFAEAVNKTLNKDLLSLGQAHDLAGFMRTGAYRNMLGPDSGLWNMSQFLNTWMSTGRFWGPMGKYLANVDHVKDYKGLIGNFTNIAREFEGKASTPMMQKIQAVDEWLNRFALAPMNWTENLLRGHAAMAGMEEAVAKGMTHDKAIVNAMAKASKVVPNLEVPEALLYAMTRTVPQTQFGGALSAQRSPFLRGPLGRLSSILITYPTQQAQFLFRGMAEGLGPDGFKALFPGNKIADPYKLARFTMGLGLMAGLPSIAANAGWDIRNQFGLQGALGNLSLPFWQMLSNGYNAALGRDPITQAQAAEAFKKSLLHFQPIVPQTRYVEKVIDVFKNIERGYDIDSHGRYIRETTPLGELMRLAGPKPEEAYDAMEMTKHIANRSMEHFLDRSKAIETFLDTKDPSAIQQYMKKYPERRITMKDLMKAQQERMKPPQERALERFPKAMRDRMRREAQEEAEGF